MESFTVNKEKKKLTNRSSENIKGHPVEEDSNRINHMISMKYMLSAVLLLFSQGNQLRPHTCCMAAL